MRERREHVRVQTPILVEFSTPGQTKVENSFTQDVSESGLRFPTAAKLEIGQELNLTLRMAARNTTLQANGDVVWIRETSRLSAPQYGIGVRFRWVKDPDRQRLLRHLDNLIQPSV